MFSLNGLHHATHSGVTHREFGLVFLLIADNTFGSEEHAGNRSCIFECYTSYLGRVNHTGSTQVDKLFGLGIIAIVTFALANLVYNNSSLNTGVAADLAERLLDGAANDGNTSGFVGIVASHTLKSLLGADVGYTTTGNNTLFDGSTGSAECIVAAILLFLLLSFAGSTYLEYANTARKFGQTLLEFLFVV